MEDVAIIDGRAMTRTQYNNWVSHLGRRQSYAPAFNPIQAPTPPPPAPSYTPPSQPQQTYSPPSAPTVASVSATNETREKAKAKSGQAKTLLSGYGGMTRARRSSTETQARSKLGLTETTKKSLLGSAG
jgi:hypothetical protein